jgi:transposase-like protein
MLKAIHAQESRAAAREKARQVAVDLMAMKLPEAARKVEDSIVDTLTYMEFPYEHWLRICTNNVIERPHTVERRFFSNLEQLFAFLSERWPATLRILASEVMDTH